MGNLGDERPRGDDTTDPRRGSKEKAEAAADAHQPKNAEHPRNGRNQPDHDEGRKNKTINNKKKGLCICFFYALSWVISTAQGVVGGQGAIAPRDAPAAYRTQGLCRGGGLTRRPAMNVRGLQPENIRA